MRRLLQICYILIPIFLFACSDRPTYKHDGHIDKEIVREPVLNHGDTPAHTADYVCPLHCEGSGSDKPGVCSVCGFDYEPLKQHISNGHNH